MAKSLPIKLQKEPLLFATCEIFVNPVQIGIATILPGYLHAKFGNEIVNMSQSNTYVYPANPSDQNSAKQSMAMQILWRNNVIVITDNTVNITAGQPYIGWELFRSDVVFLFETVLESKMISSVDRYSVKYVNIFPFEEQGGNFSDVVDWSLRVGSRDIAHDNIQLRTEAVDGDFITVLSVLSNAEAMIDDGKKIRGSIIDIDTICRYSTSDVDVFKNELVERFDVVRRRNKIAFFDSLKDTAIAAMGPTYA